MTTEIANINEDEKDSTPSQDPVAPEEIGEETRNVPLSALREARYLVKQLREKLDHQQNEQGKLETQLAHFRNQGLEKKFFTVMLKAEEDFAQNHPDYAQAADYLRARRDQDLQLWGIQDQAQRARIITQELMGFTRHAVAQGVNPAEKAYTMAKAWGYTARDPEEKAEEEKMKNYAAGVKASKSLGTIPGTSHTPISPEMLAQMDDQAFATHWSRVMRG